MPDPIEWTFDAEPPPDWRARLSDPAYAPRRADLQARLDALAGQIGELEDECLPERWPGPAAPRTPDEWRAAPEHERDAEILRLRTLGLTLEQIAARVGYAASSTVARRIEHAYAATVREPADIVRELEVRRLDELLRRVWHTMNTAPQATLAAVDRILKIMERRARLLGLDAPTRHEVLTLDRIDAEIDRLAAELTEAGLPAEEIDALRGLARHEEDT